MLREPGVRALTGHTSGANPEMHLAGVDHYPLTRAAQEALEGSFGGLLTEAEQGANTRRVAEAAGQATRKRRKASANTLPTAPAESNDPLDG